jgi:alkylated DNA nucleotide flippase Atl1
MKTRTTPSMLIALLLASLTLGVTNAQADPVPLSHHRGQDSWPSVGITYGQTARVTTANTGEREMSVVGVFLDDSTPSQVLGQFNVVIQPGNFDLNADDITRKRNRIQIRVVISSDNRNRDNLRDLVTSIEVFENDTGKTTVFIGRNDGFLQQWP